MSEKLMLNQQPSQVITKTFQSTEYNLYLSGEITDNPDDYLEHYAVYHQAGEQDVIRLWLSSHGGSVSTGTQYIKHMRDCAAPIVGIIGMGNASMSTAIALECSGWEVDDMSTFLIHGISYGAFGHEDQVYNQAVFNRKLNEKYVRNTYSGFLTESEITDALKGVDLLFDGDDLFERLQAFDEYRQAKQAEQKCGNPDCEECGFAEETELTQAEIDALLAEPKDVAPKKSRKKS